VNEQVLRLGRRGKCARPFLDRAGIAARGCSRPLQRRIADFGAERSGRQASQALSEHYGIEVPLYSVEAVTRRVAAQSVAFNVQQPSSASIARTQVVELDGSMIPIVDFAPEAQVADHQSKTDKRKRRRCQWNEVRLCTAHAVGRAQARYGACMGAALEAGLMMSLTVKQCGMDEKTHLHGIADGAPWIAEQYEKQFGTQAAFLIDFYHLCEYLGAAAQRCASEDQREGWLKQQKERLYKNDYEAVLKDLAVYLEGDEVMEEQAPVRRCWRYLTNRRSHLDYRGALEKELPIGSGEVESAHRHVIQRRLKLPGAWWSKENAAAMVQLRVVRANGEWSQFWEQKAA